MEVETDTIHNSLLVATRKGVRRIFCPFPVQVIHSVDVLHEGETHLVVSVRMNGIKLLYVIGNEAYTHSFFLILSQDNKHV